LSGTSDTSKLRSDNDAPIPRALMSRRDVPIAH
jgi:hypothetical protein